MTLDEGGDRRQGAGPAIDAYLMDRLLPARGRVNCDIMLQRLSRRNLLELLAALHEGVTLLEGVLGINDKDAE